MYIYIYIYTHTNTKCSVARRARTRRWRFAGLACGAARGPSEVLSRPLKKNTKEMRKDKVQHTWCV